MSVLTSREPTDVRWWYLPSWLGLDAPCVVSTWTWALSRSSGLTLRADAVVSLFLTVWIIHLLDRLIDVAGCRDWDNATGRMHFGRRFRGLIVACLVGCVVALAVVLLRGPPWLMVLRGLAVAAGFIVYFLLFVVPVLFQEKASGKEFGIGLFFALGAFAAVGYKPGTYLMFLGVAVVITFNTLVISARDAETDKANDPGGASRWWVNIDRDLRWLGAACSCCFRSSCLSSGRLLSTWPRSARWPA